MLGAEFHSIIVNIHVNRSKHGKNCEITVRGNDGVCAAKDAIVFVTSWHLLCEFVRQIIVTGKGFPHIVT